VFSMSYIVEKDSFRGTIQVPSVCAIQSRAC
jgi:hypothetical protein